MISKLRTTQYSVGFPTMATTSKAKTTSKKSATLDNQTRLKRNAGEKKRRDKLNNYISELSAMVPSCRTPQSGRKLDKSTILKLAVSYMKLHADLRPEAIDDKSLSWKPSFLSNEELGHLMLEALDGFFFVIWNTGQTIYVSESITPLLGHFQQDLVGKNFFDLIHPKDINTIKEKMFPEDCGLDAGYIEELGTPSPTGSTTSSTSSQNLNLRRYFNINMKRGEFNSQTGSEDYEMVYFSGHLRKWETVIRNVETERSNALPPEGYCLVGVGRLPSTQTIREMTPGAPPLNSWTSRHNLDAKYIHIDQSAASIIGYKAAELLGSSAYNLYHDDDLAALAKSHIELNKHGSGTTTLYRFLTKGQQWLWIKTHGTVQYREGTKQPQSIICHNIVVSYGEVWQFLQNKAQQYGPKEAKMPLPITDRVVPKTEVTLDDIKRERYSPSGYGGDADMYVAPKQSYLDDVRGGAAYAPPNSFKDLFPNYRPSITTEETHGKYRPLHFDNIIDNTVNSVSNANSNIKVTYANTPCSNIQNSNPAMLSTRQYLTTNNNLIYSPPQEHPNLNYVPNTSVHHSRSQQPHPSPPQQVATTHHPNIPVSSYAVHPPTYQQQATISPPQQTTLPPQPLPHGQPLHVASNPNTKYIAIHTPPGSVLRSSNVILCHPQYVAVTDDASQIPNITIRPGGMATHMTRHPVVHAEEPVVGMPVSGTCEAVPTHSTIAKTIHHHQHHLAAAPSHDVASDVQPNVYCEKRQHSPNTSCSMETQSNKRSKVLSPSYTKPCSEPLNSYYPTNSHISNGYVNGGCGQPAAGLAAASLRCTVTEQAVSRPPPPVQMIYSSHHHRLNNQT